MTDQEQATAEGPLTLGIDVGGTGLKAAVVDTHGEMVGERVRIDTPYPCPPDVMVDALVELVAPLAATDRVSVGFPGVVRGGRIITAPHFGTEFWSGFALAAALQERLGLPTRVLNDADMQGLGVIEGQGLELVVTLGTGVGTALFQDGWLMPHLELAHHPVSGKGKTYNQYLGNAARKKVGEEKWNRRVHRALGQLRALVLFDRLYLGGGNARRITFDLDPDTRIVSNTAGILGGIALWREVGPEIDELIAACGEETPSPS